MTSNIDSSPFSKESFFAIVKNAYDAFFSLNTALGENLLERIRGGFERGEIEISWLKERNSSEDTVLHIAARIMRFNKDPKFTELFSLLFEKVAQEPDILELRGALRKTILELIPEHLRNQYVEQHNIVLQQKSLSSGEGSKVETQIVPRVLLINGDKIPSRHFHLFAGSQAKVIDMRNADDYEQQIQEAKAQFEQAAKENPGSPFTLIINTHANPENISIASQIISFDEFLRELDIDQYPLLFTIHRLSCYAGYGVVQTKKDGKPDYDNQDSDLNSNQQKLVDAMPANSLLVLWGGKYAAINIINDSMAKKIILQDQSFFSQQLYVITKCPVTVKFIYKQQGIADEKEQIITHKNFYLKRELLESWMQQDEAISILPVVKKHIESQIDEFFNFYLKTQPEISELEKAKLEQDVRTAKNGITDKTLEEYVKFGVLIYAGKEKLTDLEFYINNVMTRLKRERPNFRFDIHDYILECSPVFSAFSANDSQKSREIAELFLQQGLDIEHCDKEKSTILFYAASAGNLYLTELLLSKGAKMEKKSEMGFTPFHAACVQGHLPIVQLFIQKNGNLNTRNKRGDSPLHSACKADHKGIVDFILKTQINKFKTIAGHGYKGELFDDLDIFKKDVDDILLSRETILDQPIKDSLVKFKAEYETREKRLKPIPKKEPATRWNGSGKPLLSAPQKKSNVSVQ
ncbi:MAG: ankyrin repeat domain-containing protein [Pseudomonadota bacterium]